MTGEHDPFECSACMTVDLITAMLHMIMLVLTMKVMMMMMLNNFFCSCFMYYSLTKPGDGRGKGGFLFWDTGKRSTLKMFREESEEREEAFVVIIN